MTLILSMLDRDGVNQVSDRLMSRGGRPYDPLWNKNVVWEARNGVVVIGYTGHAVLEGRRTDQWIAELLRGQDLGPTGGRTWAQMEGRALISPDIGRGMQILQAGASRAFRAIGSRAMPHEFIVSGWQWNKKGCGRPVLYRVYNGEVRSEFRISCLRRHWGWEHQQRVTQPNPSDLYDDLPPDFAARVADCTTLRDRQDALVEGVRHIADRHPGTVGEDCMSITLYTPGERVGDITFLPLASRMRRYGSGPPLSFAYSPWLVSSDFVQRPVALRGSWRVRTGKFVFTQNGPSDPELPVALHGLPN